MIRVYFDNAATTPLLPEVLETMMPYLKEQFGNPSTQYSYGREARSAVETARKQIASFLNAQPGEIIFTSGGTESSNIVLYNAVNHLGIKRIITSQIEHHCVLHSVEYFEKTNGIKAEYMPVNSKGEISLELLETLLADKSLPTLVTLMHANNEIGVMIPLAEVAALCSKYGALFHSDTVQTFAHCEIDTQKIPVDFIGAAAHKFHGPKGAGFLYARKGRSLQPMLYGGGQERGMRSGTENVSGIVGLAKAAEVAYASLKEDADKILRIKLYCLEKIKEYFPGVSINGPDPEDSLYTILNLSFPPHQAGPLSLFALDMEGVCVSGGSACSSGASQGSHVIQAIGGDADRVNIRFSFSKLNTKEEVDFAVEKLRKVFG